MVTTKSGEVKTVSLADAKQYTRKSCVFCPDFSAELADISVGGLGLSGWTFTVLRTKRGEELFKGAERAGLLKTRSMEEEERAFGLLVKLSKKKRKTAESYSMT